MNRDGYPDLVQFGPSSVNVALWNGAAFNPVIAWTTGLSGAGWADGGKNPRRLADMNGDGFPDLIGFANDGVYVALSNGRDGASAPTRWTTEFPANATDSHGNVWDNAAINSPRHVLDMDGDGIPDILGLGSASVRWASPVGAPGTRVVGITDSLGATISLKYSLTQQYSGFYANDQPSAGWPLRDAHGPVLVVTEVARDNGVGGVQKTRHRYGGRKAHFDHGPLGFRWIATRDESTGIETRTDFEQTYPHVGSPKLVETYRSSLSGESIVNGCTNSIELCSKAFTITKNQPSISRSSSVLDKEVLGSAGEYASNTRFFIFARSVTDERWELDGTPLPTKTTTSEYEEPRIVGSSKQWGNLTKRTVAISDGHSTTTVNSFEPAVESNWTLGRLSRTSVSSTRPARTISVSTQSDAAPPTSAAGPLPVSRALLAAIIGLMLDD